MKGVIGMKIFTALVFFFGIFPGPFAWSYTEIPVTNGGSISGNVLLMGKEPSPKAFNLVTFPDPVFCGRISTGTGWRLVDDFQVAPDRGLRNVVVFLEGIDRGKAFPTSSPKVMAEDCVFSPSVLVVRHEQAIQVVNMDPILHDVQMYETAPFGAEVMVHRPLRLNPHHPRNQLENHEHLPGDPLLDTIQFSKGRRIFFLECGFHAYMQTWGIAVTNPYYAVTDEGGSFTISDIPEGVYKLIAWHPGMGGILDMKVVVLADDTLKPDLSSKPPPAPAAIRPWLRNPILALARLGNRSILIRLTRSNHPERMVKKSTLVTNGCPHSTH